MEKYNKFLDSFVNHLKKISEVEAVLLSGSLTFTSSDKFSDIDLYIYLNKELSPKTREVFVSRYSSYMEIDNNFWETEDCFIEKESGVKVELIYRNLDWIKEQLERTVIRCEAWVGYSTTFYHNFMTSTILFDRNSILTKLQDSYNIPYSDKLKNNVINKNFPLLKDCMSSYYNQIKIAIYRDDIVSINHRIAGFLASYFDVLFAINKISNPGEKKMTKIVNSSCKIIPKDFDKNINDLFLSIDHYKEDLLVALDNLVYNIKDLI